jgi:NTP pyrophosphatase (non-canonical NTP hydrolase)
MDNRPVSKDFVYAMERKLDYGREQGRVGWDTYWKESTFDSPVFDGLKAKFYEEVTEVFAALAEDNLENVADECVDVANLAMMLWDFIHQKNNEEFLNG